MGRIPSLRRQYLDLNLELIKAEIQRDELAQTARLLRARAEKAEAERDEARTAAVWADQDAWGAWMAFAPNLVLSEGAWGDDLGHADLFHTEDEALSAGRAVPWWTQAEGERDEEESRFQSGRALIRHQENTIRSLAGQVASLQPGAKDCALRVRAERAEKALKRAREERDEARAQAVWAEPVYYPGATVPLWRVYCPPGGTPLATEGWGGGGILDFATEAEALAAGRAVPWWTQGEGVEGVQRG